MPFPPGLERGWKLIRSPAGAVSGWEVPGMLTLGSLAAPRVTGLPGFSSPDPRQGQWCCSETRCHPQPKVPSRALFRAQEKKGLLESSRFATLESEKNATSGGESRHRTRFPSAQEGEHSHQQPLVTALITLCLAFFPFQMLMQYLYYGGTESMEIPTTDILEVRELFLPSLAKCAGA